MARFVSGLRLGNDNRNYNRMSRKEAFDNDFDDVDSGIPEPKQVKVSRKTIIQKEDDTNHDKNTIERIGMERITAQRNRRK